MAQMTETGRAKAREAQRRYRESEKGKAAIAAHREKWIELRREFRATPEGREERRRQRKAYKETLHGRALTNEYFRRSRNRNMSRERSVRLWALARNAVPAHLPADIRDDIIMDIIAAVMEGKFLMKDIPKCAKAIISANLKHNSKFGPVSLDAARFHDSHQTLHDVVTEGLW